MKKDRAVNKIIADRHKVFFFAGAESRDEKFNVFTGSYIRLMKQILQEDFEHVKGVNYGSSALNVIWALNNAQKPIVNPQKDKITSGAVNRIIAGIPTNDCQVTITSSSSGSIIAAQAACYLAEKNSRFELFSLPFHLVLGASMLSEESDLFHKLKKYQKMGVIGKIVHDEVLDKDDSANGVGGKTRGEAYSNAFGLMFPVFSRKYTGPSFLNTHPEKGHVHRKRSKTVQKSLDYIDVILIRNKLAGEEYREKAIAVINDVSTANLP